MSLLSSERLLRRAAGAVLVLNLIDATLTLGVVELGLADEANPLMATSLGWGSVPFMLVKLTLVCLGVVLLWRHRARRSAAAALLGTAAVYSVLALYHVQSVQHIARALSGVARPLG